MTNNVEEEKDTIEEIYPVTGTPFTLIKTTAKKGWMISVGLNIADSAIFETKRKAITYIKKKPWMLIITASRIINQTKTQTT